MEIVAYKVELLEKFAIFYYCHLLNFTICFNPLIIECKDVDKVIRISIFLHHILCIEVLIYAVCNHTLTDSRSTQVYIIYVLVSFLLSFEIRPIHLASYAILFFSAALMILKFLTILLFFSSSLMRVGISSESMVSMLI